MCKTCNFPGLLCVDDAKFVVFTLWKYGWCRISLICCTFLEFPDHGCGFSKFGVVRGNCGQNTQNLHDSLTFRGVLYRWSAI